MNDLLLLDKTENIINQFERKLFDTAIKLLKGQISSCPIIKLTDSKKSPVVIPFSEIENSFIIFYPPNSDHYVDCWEGEAKVCKILEGKIYENNEKKVYKKDDEFVIDKNTKYDPYTKDGFCLAFVKKVG